MGFRKLCGGLIIWQQGAATRSGKFASGTAMTLEEHLVNY